MSAFQHFVSTAGIDELVVVALAIASAFVVISYALVKVALRRTQDWTGENNSRGAR